MRATLKEMEKEMLAEGREWTRLRLEERLQQEAGQIAAVCPQSGLVLKRQQTTCFTLMTVAGSVTVKATRGYSTATGIWVCPVREHWGLVRMAAFESGVRRAAGLQRDASRLFRESRGHVQVLGQPHQR